MKTKTALTALLMTALMFTTQHALANKGLDDLGGKGDSQFTDHALRGEAKVLNLTNLALTRVSFAWSGVIKLVDGRSVAAKYKRLDLQEGRIVTVQVDKNGEGKIIHEKKVSASALKAVSYELSKGICVTPKPKAGVSCLQIYKPAYAKIHIPTLGFVIGEKADSCAQSRDICGDGKVRLHKALLAADNELVFPDKPTGK